MSWIIVVRQAAGTREQSTWPLAGGHDQPVGLDRKLGERPGSVGGALDGGAGVSVHQRVSQRSAQAS
jgi:hypothetical protein